MYQDGPGKNDQITIDRICMARYQYGKNTIHGGQACASNQSMERRSLVKDAQPFGGSHASLHDAEMLLV